MEEEKKNTEEKLYNTLQTTGFIGTLPIIIILAGVGVAAREFVKEP